MEGFRSWRWAGIVGMVLLCHGWAAPASAAPPAPGAAKAPGACEELRSGGDHELFGLCHAFCEARRCDGEHAFDRSCSRLLGRFRARSHDVPMPCLARRIPESARLVTLGTFDRLVSDGEVVPAHEDDAATQAAEADAEMQEDLGTIRAFEQDTGAQIRLPVEPNDPSVTRLSSESYLHRIPMRNGSEQKVLTLGPRWVISGIADDIRNFGTRTNQLGLYGLAYDLALEAGDRDLVADMPSPDEIAAHPDLHPVREITNDLAVLRGAGDQIIAGLPILAGVAPGDEDCSADIGRDRDSDRAPPDPSCGFDPQGLYENATWNHKYDHTCVKAQGARGSCVAFAVAAATEFEVYKKHHLRVNLSEQALYNRMKFTWERRDFGDGFSNTKALQSAIAEGYLLPFESQWNYNQSLQRLELKNADDEVFAYLRSCFGYPASDTCSNSTHQSAEVCAVGPFGATVCGWQPPNVNPGNLGFRIKSAFVLWDPDTQNSAQSVNLARLALAGGYSVTLGFAVTPQFDAANCNNNKPPLCKSGPDAGVVTYVLNEDPMTFRGGHAVLAVGFIDNTDLPPGVPDGDGGGYFIVKNSWGHCWGDGGYAYVPYEYFRTYVYEADVLEEVY